MHLPSPLSLRAVLAAATSALVVIALIATAALLFLTSALHRTVEGAVGAVESVRLAEEAEIDLLLHARAEDAVLRRDLEESLRRRLVRARHYVATAEEQAALSEAWQRVEAYVASSRATGASQAALAEHEQAAYAALESLVTINVDQALEGEQRAARWERLATTIAVLSAILLVGAAAWTILWLRGRAFAPVLALAGAMDRFGRGDRSARAAELGPSELREMSRRFNEMASGLAERRERQLAALGGVAHDLRNPLSVLKIAVGALTIQPASTSGDPSVLDRMRRQIGRLERMLDDFVEVSRIDAGELDLRLERIDLRRVTREVVEQLDHHDGHELSLELPDVPIEVECDPLRFEQIVTNLVSNAQKYSSPGTAVQVALERTERGAVLRVSDRGIGIAPEEQAAIFEPFRRARETTRGVAGSGLGLFVVKRLVEAHGGSIWLESTPGAGSTFRVLLPWKVD